MHLHSLSIVIPAYNEALRLPATLRQILEWLNGQSYAFSEIIVVDDGSRDNTVNAALQVPSGSSTIRVVKNPGNRGKGYAVRHGMLEAKGEWILFTDADLSTPIEEIQSLYKEIEKNNAVIAFGSRALVPSLVEVHQSAFREFSGRMFNRVMRALTGLSFLDTQCGFKLFRADAARAIYSRQRLDGFSFDVEALFIARVLGLKAVEVPVRWRNVVGTKVDAWNGVQSFLDLLVIRWNSAMGRYRKS